MFVVRAAAMSHKRNCHVVIEKRHAVENQHAHPMPNVLNLGDLNGMSMIFRTLIAFGVSYQLLVVGNACVQLIDTYLQLECPMIVLRKIHKFVELTITRI